MLPETQRPEPHPLLLDLGDQTWGQWRQHPCSRVYLRFLEDQLLHFRQVAADLVEVGGEKTPELLNELRGRILTMRELQGLTLADIRQFYLPEQDIESEEDNGAGTEADTGPPG